MVKCVVCRGKTGSLRRQLCPDCHIWKELTQKYGKDAIIDQLPAITTALKEAKDEKSFLSKKKESDFSRARKRTQSIRATRKALGLKEPAEFSDDMAADSASPTSSRPSSLYIETTTEIAEATESPVRGSRMATGSQSTSGLDAIADQPTPPTRKKGRRVSAPVDAFDYRPPSVSVTPDLETDEVPVVMDSEDDKCSTSSVPDHFPPPPRADGPANIAALADPDLYQARHTFEGEHEEQMSFAKKSLIRVTTRSETGWWEGSLLNEGMAVVSSGWFPASYIKKVRPAARGRHGSTTSRESHGGISGRRATSTSSVHSAGRARPSPFLEKSSQPSIRSQLKQQQKIMARKSANPEEFDRAFGKVPSNISLSVEDRLLEDEAKEFEREWSKIEGDNLYDEKLMRGKQQEELLAVPTAPVETTGAATADALVEEEAAAVVAAAVAAAAPVDDDIYDNIVVVNGRATIADNVVVVDGVRTIADNASSERMTSPVVPEETAAATARPAEPPLPSAASPLVPTAETVEARESTVAPEVDSDDDEDEAPATGATEALALVDPENAAILAAVDDEEPTEVDPVYEAMIAASSMPPLPAPIVSAPTPVPTLLTAAPESLPPSALTAVALAADEAPAVEAPAVEAPAVEAPESSTAPEVDSEDAKEAHEAVAPEAAVVVEVAVAAEAPITTPSRPPVVNDGRPPPPPVPTELQPTLQVPEEVEAAPSAPLPAAVPPAPVELLDDDMPPPPPMPLEESPSRLLVDFDFGLPPPPPPLDDDLMQSLGDSEDDEELEAPGLPVAPDANDIAVAAPAQLADAAAAATGEEAEPCPELNAKAGAPATLQEDATACPEAEVRAADARLQAQNLVDNRPALSRSSSVQAFEGAENNGAAIARTEPGKDAAKVDKTRAILQENNAMTIV